MINGDKLTIEKINQSLNEYLKEHLDEFYFMDYSSGMSLVNVDELERVLKEYENKVS